MGYVSQEPVLFDASISDNILYGLPSASSQQIQEAAKTANAYDFIMKADSEEKKQEEKQEEAPSQKGFERIVGNKGAKLSGGEKQRIAIARAIIRNPVLLLLDEATSALDKISEEGVNQGLKQAMQGRTSVIVAHRITTIKEADLIYVIENGAVVEQGSFDELINKKQKFYDIAFAAKVDQP